MGIREDTEYPVAMEFPVPLDSPVELIREQPFLEEFIPEEPFPETNRRAVLPVQPRAGAQVGAREA